MKNNYPNGHPACSPRLISQTFGFLTILFVLCSIRTSIFQKEKQNNFLIKMTQRIMNTLKTHNLHKTRASAKTHNFLYRSEFYWLHFIVCQRNNPQNTKIRAAVPRRFLTNKESPQNMRPFYFKFFANSFMCFQLPPPPGKWWMNE